MPTGKDEIPLKNQSITRQKIQAWWNLRHLTFTFPPMFRGHVHEWCSISSDSVGCSLCGVVHICGCSQNIIACNIELQDDSSTVCTYTGIVIKSSSLFDPETSISEYNAGSSTQGAFCRITTYDKRAPSLLQKTEVLHSMTRKVIWMLFFSPQAQNARDLELLRYNRKIVQIFTAHSLKKKNSFRHCNILEGIELCCNGVATYRKPVDIHGIPPLQHFDHLQHVIILLLSHIELPRQFIFSESNERLKNLIISLVYISSDGISFQNHVFLPKFVGLKNILPLELMLAKCFGIQPKIVTDGENVIKLSIKQNTKKLHPYHCAPLCDFPNTFVCTCPKLHEEPMQTLPAT